MLLESLTVSFLGASCSPPEVYLELFSQVFEDQVDVIYILRCSKHSERIGAICVSDIPLQKIEEGSHASQQQ